jgi:hypothetical protein
VIPDNQAAKHEESRREEEKAEQDRSPRLENYASADATRNDCKASAQVVQRMTQKTEDGRKAFPDRAQGREDGFAHGRAAEQKEADDRKRHAQAQSASALKGFANAAQIGLRSHCHNLREIFRHLHARIFRQSVIQLKQEPLLSVQFPGATRAPGTMLFEQLTRLNVKLAVKVGDDLFASASLIVLRLGAHYLIKQNG